MRHVEGSIRPTPRPVSIVPSRDVSIEPSSRYGPDRDALQVELFLPSNVVPVFGRCLDVCMDPCAMAIWSLF